MAVIKRREWGAKAPKNTTPLPISVRGVALHWVGVEIKGDTTKVVRGIQRYHQETRGYFDVAYNYLISLDGQVFEGRGWNNRSGANGSSKLNRQYGAICLLMGPGQEPTEEMIDATRNTIKHFRQIYPRATEIVGHRDINPTACPGDSVHGLIGVGSFDPALPGKEGKSTSPKSGYPVPSRMLRKGSRGDDVRWLQHRLNEKGAKPKLVVDGVFGRITQRQVRRYQSKRWTLLVDGVVGPNTLRSLLLPGGN